jgi:anti-sigma-K factor RskA
LPYGLPEATPPAELRQRVLDYATGRTSHAPARRPARLRGWLLGLGSLAAAAIVAAAIGWGQAIGLRGELAQAQNDLGRTRAALETLRAEQERVVHVVQEAETLAVLQGANGDGTLLSTQQGEALLAAHLPPLQPGRIYQLWRIQGNSPPSSAGLFSIGPLGYGVFALEAGQQPQAGETVAVTNEPSGGSPGPTTQPLIVGEVKT